MCAYGKQLECEAMSDSVGVWEPRGPVRLDTEKLHHLVHTMAEADPDDLAKSFSPEEIRNEAGLMQQSEDAWQVASSLEDADIETLIRFFTLAEMQFPGWEAGKHSPVIYLVRILKHRGSFTPALRKWIKANTDNRYLPYGSAL